MKKQPELPYQTFPTWRTFVKTSALFVTVSGMLVAQTGCSSGETYETVEVVDTVRTTELTQGVITTVTEVAKGQFQIEDEKTVSTKDSSRVIVKYMDGRKDTMTIDQVKAIVTAQDSLGGRDTSLHVVQTTDTKKTTQPQYASSYSPSMHTLGYVLMGGAMGYFLGKSLAMPPNPNVYRYPQQMYHTGWNTPNPPNWNGGKGYYQGQGNYYANTYNYNTTTSPSSSSSGSSSSSSGRSYGGSSSSSSSSTARPNPYSSLRSTATTRTTTRTSYRTVSSGKSGFFGSSRSSSGRSSSGGRSSGG